MCISKMLETICSELKVYLKKLMAAREMDELARQEQVFFNQHQRKTLENMDHFEISLQNLRLVFPAKDWWKDE